MGPGLPGFGPKKLLPIHHQPVLRQSGSGSNVAAVEPMQRLHHSSADQTEVSHSTQVSIPSREQWGVGWTGLTLVIRRNGVRDGEGGGQEDGVSLPLSCGQRRLIFESLPPGIPVSLFMSPDKNPSPYSHLALSLLHPFRHQTRIPLSSLAFVNHSFSFLSDSLSLRPLPPNRIMSTTCTMLF